MQKKIEKNAEKNILNQNTPDENSNTHKSKYINNYLQKKHNPQNLSEQKTGNPIFSALGTASTMGLHMVSGPLVGTGLGYLCDTHLFHSYPYGTIVGLILGIVAGFRNVQIDARRLEKKQNEIDSNKKNANKENL